MSVCLIESINNINICSQIKVIVGHSGQKPVALCTMLVGGAQSDYETAAIKQSHSQINLSLMAGSSTMLRADLDSYQILSENGLCQIQLYSFQFITNSTQDNILKK